MFIRCKICRITSTAPLNLKPNLIPFPQNKNTSHLFLVLLAFSLVPVALSLVQIWVSQSAHKAQNKFSHANFKPEWQHAAISRASVDQSELEASHYNVLMAKRLTWVRRWNWQAETFLVSDYNQHPVWNRYDVLTSIKLRLVCHVIYSNYHKRESERQRQNRQRDRDRQTENVIIKSL